MPDYNSRNEEASLMIRHLTVDEAMPLVDEFLHRSYIAGLAEVFIIHGKGTGTLRLLVEQILKQHPLVKSYRRGGRGEGGGGVTVAVFSG
ncbi:Smr/MutS family protein [Chloroflexota bacterium]